ncbi:hypothetical protein D9758_012915 [Tetrapyrgos nigripes]|uniref:Uncharacterized protein n=1 Tax=Tetrapyrgos nigripes TaxID=182062 RepID=A0A8H5FPK4_9AGAR|nr:hypothetical protein D9758_012915 [Tetrapyrgos nigripes]
MSTPSTSYTNTSLAVLGSNDAISALVNDALAKHSGVKKTHRPLLSSAAFIFLETLKLTTQPRANSRGRHGGGDR